MPTRQMDSLAGIAELDLNTTDVSFSVVLTKMNKTIYYLVSHIHVITKNLKRNLCNFSVVRFERFVVQRELTEKSVIERSESTIATKLTTQLLA